MKSIQIVVKRGKTLNWGRFLGVMASVMMNRLRNLDAYPKINDDFYSRTLSGGLITVLSSLVMLILFFSELRKHFTCLPSISISDEKVRIFLYFYFFFFPGLYLHPVTETQLRVDTSRGEKLRINVKQKQVLFPLLLF